MARIDQFTSKTNIKRTDVVPILDKDVAPNTAGSNKKTTVKNLQKREVVTKNDDFTLLFNDGALHINVDKETAVNITIRDSSLEVGDEVVIEQVGAGIVTLVASSVTINNASGLVSSGVGSGFRLFKKSVDTFLAESLTGGGASSLSEMSDVSDATPTDDHALMGNGTTFASRALVEADISDLDKFTQAEVAAIETGLQTQINDLDLGKADLVGGLVPASQLPSFIDDVLEGEYINSTTFNDLDEAAYTPESGKVYIDVNTNQTYRWSGSAYVVIGNDLALGSTSSTAHRGDHGVIAYDHSQEEGNPHGTTIADISGLENELLNRYSKYGVGFLAQTSDSGDTFVISSAGIPVISEFTGVPNYLLTKFSYGAGEHPHAGSVLQLDSLTAYPLLNQMGGALEEGDIETGVIYLILRSFTDVDIEYRVQGVGIQSSTTIDTTFTPIPEDANVATLNPTKAVGNNHTWDINTNKELVFSNTGVPDGASGTLILTTTSVNRAISLGANISVVTNGIEIVNAIGSSDLTVTNAVSEGGEIMLEVIGHGLSTDNTVAVTGVTGTVEATGIWVIEVFDANNIILSNSVFVETYISGGVVRLQQDSLYSPPDSTVSYDFTVQDGTLFIKNINTNYRG